MTSHLGSNKYESYLINDYLKKETIPAEHKVFIPKFLGIKVNIDELPSLQQVKILQSLVESEGRNISSSTEEMLQA